MTDRVWSLEELVARDLIRASADAAPIGQDGRSGNRIEVCFWSIAEVAVMKSSVDVDANDAVDGSSTGT